MQIKKYFVPLLMLTIFETIAITLWLTKNEIFYLFNFSYIGISISLGMFLLIKRHPYGRRIVQLLVGLYMLVYLGIIRGENMQIEGFWYYLFSGVFEAATIHYAVAKFGPALRQRMVRLRMLDGYGAGFPALQSTEASQKESGLDPVHNLCGILDFCGGTVPCRGTAQGGDYLLGIYHR